MKSLLRNWLVVSKLTWGIWQILTQAHKIQKNVNFNGLLWSKVYIVWAKKLQRSYRSWHWRVMQNFDRNWLIVSKLTWGVLQILTRAHKSLKKILFSMSSFLPGYIFFELKKLPFMTLKIDAKFGEELICWFKIDMKKLTHFDPTTQKFKNVSL